MKIISSLIIKYKSNVEALAKTLFLCDDHCLHCYPYDLSLLLHYHFSVPKETIFQLPLPNLSSAKGLPRKIDPQTIDSFIKNLPANVAVANFHGLYLASPSGI